MTRKYSSIKDHGFWNPDATVTVTNNPIDLIKDLQIEIEDLKSRLKESDEQNERYEKALEFYADANNWTESILVEATDGKIAREALKE